MDQSTDLLIIGAGPFGLALASLAGARGLDYRIVGRSMEFWRAHMPEGMILRSDCDWHLDPLGEHTILRYLEDRGLSREEVEPLSLDFYLGYVEWFRQQKGIEPQDVRIERLDRRPDGSFAAHTSDGGSLVARTVVLAVGMGYFEHVPEELTAMLPPGRGVHTRDLVDLRTLAGRRCLIVGGRQSAFEWTALAREAGAAAIHVVHRHPTPAFAEADWSWVKPLVDRTEEDPGWYRRLSAEEKEAILRGLFAQGRLKVEPWLWPRVDHHTVTIWPDTRLTGCEERPDGALAVSLDSGDTLVVDEVLFATGYKVEMGRLPFLADGNLLPQLATTDGFPELDEGFQSSVPGLFVTSLPAARDFGPFFGFTVSVRASARVIADALQQRAASPAG